MGIAKAGSSANIQDLMKILELTQTQSVDLAKKFIKIAHVNRSVENLEAGKGQNIDVSA